MSNTQLNSMGLTFSQGKLMILDQQLLPHQELWLEITHVDQMIDAIKKLKVRGAPLIGVAAAMALGQSAKQGTPLAQLKTEAQKLYEARPTAVNLMICIERMQKVLNEGADAIWNKALEIFHEDVQLCENIAKHGVSEFVDGDSILTHCNAGAIATVGIGTALGVVRKVWESGKKIHVYVDETRPLLQGGRLTAWELQKLGIPFTLISDNMAGFLMAQGKISKVILGSDRIAANGDFANKIGTYSVAVLAHHHRIPFYVAAPWTTVDKNCPSGKDIPIEERHEDEVRGYGTLHWAPSKIKVYNPAFDVTPAELVTGWVMDRGLYNKNDARSGIFSK